MRILHVHSGNIFGGIETLLCTVGDFRYAQAGVQHEFALCFEARLSAQLAHQQAPLHQLGPVRLRNPLSVWRARSRLRDVLARNCYDTVLIHSAWAHVVFAETSRDAGTRLSYWLHGPTSRHHWLNRRAKRLTPAVLMANSRYTAAASSDLYPGKRCVIIHPPVAPPPQYPLASRDEFRTKLNAASTDVVVVQVGRMEEWKGYARTITALARTEVTNWAYWLVGAPQRPHEHRLFQGLQNLASRLGVRDKVSFLGYRSDIAEVLAAADVYCQPNTQPEPFGVALIEALYAGLPVVSVRAGGASEIFQEDEGALVTPADDDALLNALNELLASEKRRRDLGVRGPARATELCDPRRQIERLNAACSGLPDLGGEPSE
jgi:glycosyltransferase involved in cell wall biosynthesis